VPTPDGGGYIIALVYTTYEAITTINYSIPPSPGSQTTMINVASGSVDTTSAANDPEINSAISSTTIVHYYASGNDQLGPQIGPTLPPQGPNFQSRMSDYTMYGGLWEPSGSGTSICDTQLVLAGLNGLYVTNPPGCNNHTLY
jgi:hypothetical protein